MMGWSGWSTAGGITMTVGMIALAALAVAGVFLLIWPVFSREVRAPNVPTVEGIGEESGGLRLLAERYARGEIDREEFLERRQYLAGHSR
jgi:putative membrane protein